MIRSRTALFLSIVSVLALTLGACAADAANESVDSEPPASAPAEPDLPSAGTSSEAATAAAGSGTAVTTGEVAQHGTVLTDGTGLTLYVFFEDSEGMSTCYDACADNWPPLITEGAPTAEGGADQVLLSTTERDDGSMQVTYDGQPLYLYSGDSQPGDANGFGQGNVWYPVSPDGAPMDVAGHAGHSEPAADGY
jgi:predicted lipoprotein with Yx(FWY)xxD motif